MKRKIFGLLLALLICNSFCMINVNAAEESVSFFVDCNAEASGDGSFSSPFKTLDEAQKAVRELKKSGNYPSGGITVNIREGIYKRSETLRFTEEDSGIEGAPVTWRAYQNETVKLVGGAELSLSDFKVSEDSRIEDKLKGKIYEYNLLDNGIEPYDKLYVTGHSSYYLKKLGMVPEGYPVPEVFYNNETTQLARYPNEGYIQTGKIIQEGDHVIMWAKDGEAADLSYFDKEMIPMKFVVDDERILKWGDAKHAWVFGYWKHDYSDQTTPVKEIDVNAGTITTKYPSAFKIASGRNFYIYNLFEELDVPGEWYYDVDNGNFYIYPKDTNPNSKIMLAFAANDIVAFSDNAQYINLRGISVAGSRTNGIDINNASNIKISYCLVENVSNTGIDVTYAHDITIEGCTIRTIGFRGVSLESCGDSTTLESTNISVVNNHIHNFGRLIKTYAPGIHCGIIGGYIAHNTIHNAPHAAIVFSGNDNIFEYNDIYDVVKECSDMGAIYTGSSMIRRGNVFRYNTIHDIYSTTIVNAGVYAIYFDSMFSGTTVTENLIYNIGGSGVLISGGRNTTVTNNVFVNVDGVCTYLWATARFTSWYNGLPDLTKWGVTEEYTKNPAYAKYPNMTDFLEDDPYDPKYNVIKNNVCVNVGEEMSLSPDMGGSTYTMKEMLEDNTVVNGYVSKTDPGFVDAKSGNYALKSTSEVFEALPEFVNLKPEKAGLLTSRLRSALENNAVAVAVGKNGAYVNWKQTITDSDSTVTPYATEDTVYVPLRFALEGIGGKVGYENGIVTVDYNGEKINLTVDSNTATVDGTNVELTSPVKQIGTKTYIPVDIVNQLFGYEVYTHESGIVIISKDSVENIMDDEVVSDLYNRL